MWSVSSAGSRQGGLESPVDARNASSTTLSSISSASTKNSPLFAQPTPPGGVGLNALSPPDFTFPAMPILHTMWPTSLPSPATVHHLVELFFRRCVLPATIFDAPRILASLLENPASGAFPETALLHAIMSYASPHGSEDCIEGRYWDVLGEGRSRRRWHYELALDEFEKASALIFQPALNRCGMSRGLKPDAPSSTSNWRPIRPTNPLQVSEQGTALTTREPILTGVCLTGCSSFDRVQFDRASIGRFSQFMAPGRTFAAVELAAGSQQASSLGLRA